MRTDQVIGLNERALSFLSDNCIKQEVQIVVDGVVVENYSL
jgi:hypothetical protein